MNMYSGQILLGRENELFRAGFCLIKATLPGLLERSNMLHPSESMYFNTLKYDRRKTSYLLGRIAAKNAVLQQINQEVAPNSFSVTYGVFQFPVVKHLPSNNIQVSISHCDQIGFAVGFPEEHPMGIDIEKIDADKIEAMKSMICAEEFDKINTLPVSILIGSTLIWTIKEALSKVLRTGLMIDFKILEIGELKKEEESYTSTFKHFSQYKAVSYHVGDYIYSLVLPKNTSCDLVQFHNILRTL
ncbi:4'-phosphopantetheinyl transferase superfamily protein [Aquimarina sp. RZ0]|uniref:4'-phosphopantetheinyl transferase family protein n=1 Tax=Aquimarina sp. RZ0 TaxID=2607730 RepID=UPI0011F16C53|nr:4'-phosphopantetheinyl transferase superfamily protein [Aquimarina sp. RZ0]KAA1244368.1 4'-phosphopantetheinyl transferase superfamily protein [Aquimarina sp. RZ0]